MNYLIYISTVEGANSPKAPTAPPIKFHNHNYYQANSISSRYVVLFRHVSFITLKYLNILFICKMRKKTSMAHPH